MSKLVNYVRRMWQYARGDVAPAALVPKDFDDLIHQLKVNGYGLADKYSAKIYNIVEIGIPNDKHAILRRGIEDIMSTLVESINLHVIMELDKVIASMSKDNGLPASQLPLRSDSSTGFERANPPLRNKNN